MENAGVISTSYGQKIETAENTGVPCSHATLPRIVSNDVYGIKLPYQNGVNGRKSRGPIFLTIRGHRSDLFLRLTGMPRVMIPYGPMEIVVTPEITYILMERDFASSPLHSGATLGWHGNRRPWAQTGPWACLCPGPRPPAVGGGMDRLETCEARLR
jgi:hypothetical protein